MECGEESDGFGGKSNGNKGGRQLTATRAMATVIATTWVMATVTRLTGDKEGKGEGGKGDGDGDEGGRRQRGNGDGSKSDGNGDNGGGRAMVMVLSMADLFSYLLPYPVSVLRRTLIPYLKLPSVLHQTLIPNLNFLVRLLVLLIVTALFGRFKKIIPHYLTEGASIRATSESLSLNLN